MNIFNANGGNIAAGEPPVEQIETFISDIRQQVSRRDFGRDENFEVEVEDLCSEETLAGLNRLPVVDCPLSLVDLREVPSNLDGIIQEARDGGNIRHGVVNTDIRALGEPSVASSTVIREDNIRPPVTGNGLDTGAGLEPGNRIVVNLSKRHLTEAEVSLLSKRLKFCPTTERIDIYNVRKDIRDYVRRIRLREYFYCADEVMGTFPRCRRLEQNLPGVRKETGK